MMTTVAPDFSRPRGTRFSQTFPGIEMLVITHIFLELDSVY
jgi:hypothetical protein